MKMSANEIGKIANANSEAKGFWDDYNKINNRLDSAAEPYADNYREAEIAKKLMLTVSELSEAMEARRKGKVANRQLFKEELESLNFQTCFERHIKDSFEDEISDAYIRLTELAAKLGVDLDWHVEQKMKYNATREPMHGKKY